MRIKLHCMSCLYLWLQSQLVCSDFTSTRSVLSDYHPTCHAGVGHQPLFDTVPIVLRRGARQAPGRLGRVPDGEVAATLGIHIHASPRLPLHEGCA